jgi:hypothetical protein
MMDEPVIGPFAEFDCTFDRREAANASVPQQPQASVSTRYNDIHAVWRSRIDGHVQPKVVSRGTATREASEERRALFNGMERARTWEGGARVRGQREGARALERH